MDPAYQGSGAKNKVKIESYQELENRGAEDVKELV